MHYSENKRGRPEKALGFHTLGIKPLFKPDQRLKFYAEDQNGITVRQFDCFQSAKNFVISFVPKGYAVSRWFEDSEDQWLNCQVWYDPRYDGPRLKTRSMLDRYQAERPRPKPKPICSQAYPSIVDGLPMDCYSSSSR